VPTFEPPVLPRRSRGRRVGVLLFVMFFLMATAFAAIYTFMKTKVAVQGAMSFENFGKLPVLEQRRLQDQQKQLMTSERLRTVALNAFRARNPNLPAGFLGEPLEFAKNEVRVKWNDSGTMTYRLDDADRSDLDRLRAVLEGLYALDAELVHAADKNREQVKNLRSTVEQKQKDLDNFRLLREQTQKLVERQMAPDQIQALSAEKSAAEEKWKQAVAVRSAAEAELKRIEESAAANGIGQAVAAATDTTNATAANTTPSDPELAELQKNLEQMTTRLNSARATAAEQAEAARKALDGALEKFQADADALQSMTKDNPELSNFLNAAQRLQETAQKLSGDLLERTQKAYERLLEDKRYLDERIATRRKELWDADQPIKRLKDDLGLSERGYNAALTNGYDKEAGEIKQRMDQSLARIRERQMELENDPILVTLNEFKAKREQEIAASQKQLEADRKQADALAKEMEKNFAQLAPQVEKLPENQKSLAQRMASKMETVSSARKAYAEALDRKSAQVDPGLKFIEEQVNTLASKVDERKKMLVAMSSQQLTAEERQQRQDYLNQKKAAFEGLKTAETDAYNQYFEKEKAARLASTDVTAAGKARDDFERLTRQYFDLRDKELPQLKAQLQQSEQLGQAVAFPSEPRIDDPRELQDRRPMFAAMAMGGIAVFFSLLIAFTSGGGHAHPMPDYRIPVQPLPQQDEEDDASLADDNELPNPGLLAAAPDAPKSAVA
jgi:chromosome segregation ATPase